VSDNESRIAEGWGGGFWEDLWKAKEVECGEMDALNGLEQSVGTRLILEVACALYDSVCVCVCVCACVRVCVCACVCVCVCSVRECRRMNAD
jgi:hypothetical protein